MTANPPLLRQHGLDKLPLDDRIAVAEALWDSIERETEAMPLTEAQQTELARRLADSTARPEAVVPWEVVKARALARAKK